MLIYLVNICNKKYKQKRKLQVFKHDAYTCCAMLLNIYHVKNLYCYRYVYVCLHLVNLALFVHFSADTMCLHLQWMLCSCILHQTLFLHFAADTMFLHFAADALCSGLPFCSKCSMLCFCTLQQTLCSNI